jgi:predicted nucleotidyltransferase
MRISSKEQIAGIPALEARKILRLFRLSNYPQDAKDLGYRLKRESEERIAGMLNALADDGYLDKHPDGYFPTAKGRSLALASAFPPIKRARADKLVSDMVDRIKGINSNQDYLWEVKLAVVFGSYARGEDSLSDVDIGIHLIRRPLPANEDYIDRAKVRIDLAYEQGMCFQSFLQELAWPETEVWKTIKGGKRQLSIHDMNHDPERDMILNGPHIVLLGEAIAKNNLVGFSGITSELTSN